MIALTQVGYLKAQSGEIGEGLSRLQYLLLRYLENHKSTTNAAYIHVANKLRHHDLAGHTLTIVLTNAGLTVALISQLLLLQVSGNILKKPPLISTLPT